MMLLHGVDDHDHIPHQFVMMSCDVLQANVQVQCMASVFAYEAKKTGVLKLCLTNCSDRLNKECLTAAIVKTNCCIVNTVHVYAC